MRWREGIATLRRALVVCAWVGLAMAVMPVIAASLDEQFDAVARRMPPVLAAATDVLQRDDSSGAPLVEAARAAAIITTWNSRVDAIVAPALPRAIDAARAAGDDTSVALLRLYRTVIDIGESTPTAAQLSTLQGLAHEVDARGDPTASCLARMLHGLALRASVEESRWAASYLGAIGMASANARCRAMALGDLAFVNGFGIDPKNVRGELVASVLAQLARAQSESPAAQFPSLAGRLLNAEGTTYQLAGPPHVQDARRSIVGAVDVARRTDDSVLLYASLSALGAWTRKHVGAEAAVPILEETRLLTPADSIDRMVESVRLASTLANLPNPNHGRVHALLDEARRALEGVADATVYRRVYLNQAVRAYKGLGEYREALDAQDELVTLERRQASAENLARLDEMQTRFRVQQVDLENERLRTSEAVSEGRRNVLGVGLGLSALALTVLGALLVLQVRQRHRIGRLYAQLKALSASRSEFLVAACHDLRQPAHALALLAEVASSAPPDEVRRYVEDIRRTVGVLGDLLSQVLDMTQLERGEYAIHVGPVDLGALLAEVESQYRDVCRRRQLFLGVQSTALWVQSDAHLLRRIVFNVVSNACKYTEHGGVTVKVVGRDNHAILEVEDTGRGIPDERMVELFTPYARLDSAAPEEGLGIGLSVVRRAARLLGHRLEFRSRVGEGTLVRLKLPVCPPAIEAVDASPPSTGRALIGVIEDNAEVQEAFTALLRQWRFDVAGATSHDGLVAALRERGDAVPALLLVDYSLGRENGIDVVRRLRERDRWAEVPALLVTGTATADIEAAAQSIGARVLLKPTRPARLFRAIEAAIAARNAPPPASSP